MTDFRSEYMGENIFGEFMGTGVLILMGDGVVPNFLLKRSQAEVAGWLAIAAGWAFAVVCGNFTAAACGSPGAHLNPALTLAMAIISGDFSKFVLFVSAQLLGAIAGAIFVQLRFVPHWRSISDPNLNIACFSASPSIRANLLSGTIGTFVFVTVVAALSSKKLTGTGPAAGLGPYLVGVLVRAIGLSLGVTTGYAVNPARDLAARIAHSILQLAAKARSRWEYAAVPIVGPLVGATLAGLFVRIVHF